MEDRQNRIAQEQKDGGAGSAYAIAVSHMLKNDAPPAAAEKQASSLSFPSSSSRKRTSSPAADAAGVTAEHTTPTPTTSSPTTTATAATGTLPLESRIVEEGELPRDGAAAGVQGNISGELAAEAGGDHEGDDNKQLGSVGSFDDDGDVGESCSGSEGESDEDGDGGHRRRGWAERRARLRKDGMHGRRLPPPSAEEERALAKADKKEVRCVASIFLHIFIFFLVWSPPVLVQGENVSLRNRPISLPVVA